MEGDTRGALGETFFQGQSWGAVERLGRRAERRTQVGSRRGRGRVLCTTQLAAPVTQEEQESDTPVAQEQPAGSGAAGREGQSISTQETPAGEQHTGSAPCCSKAEQLRRPAGCWAVLQCPPSSPGRALAPHSALGKQRPRVGFRLG